MEWSKDNMEHFIEMYHKKSILWDPQDPEYFNKIKKQDAWMEIAGEIERPVEDCKKKMENLLASLRREKMKMKKSIGTGKGTQDVYKSNWFAFESLKFILDKNKTKSSLNTIQLQEEELGSGPQEETDPPIEAASQHEESTSVIKPPQNKRSKRTPIKAKVTTSTDSDQRLDQAFQLLQSTANQMKSREDECYYFGNVVASKLRAYEESTRCVIQNEILFIFQQAAQGRYNMYPHSTFDRSQNRHPNTVPVPLLYSSASTSSYMSHSSQNSSSSMPSPVDSTYSEDFNIQDLI